jgi:hypothetical protein
MSRLFLLVLVLVSSGNAYLQVVDSTHPNICQFSLYGWAGTFLCSATLPEVMLEWDSVLNSFTLFRNSVDPFIELIMSTGHSISAVAGEPMALPLSKDLWSTIITNDIKGLNITENIWHARWVWGERCGGFGEWDRGTLSFLWVRVSYLVANIAASSVLWDPRDYSKVITGEEKTPEEMTKTLRALLTPSPDETAESLIAEAVSLRYIVTPEFGGTLLFLRRMMEVLWKLGPCPVSEDPPEKIVEAEKESAVVMIAQIMDLITSMQSSGATEVGWKWIIGAHTVSKDVTDAYFKKFTMEVAPDVRQLQLLIRDGEDTSEVYERMLETARTLYPHDFTAHESRATDYPGRVIEAQSLAGDMGRAMVCFSIIRDYLGRAIKDLEESRITTLQPRERNLIRCDRGTTDLEIALKWWPATLEYMEKNMRDM